MSSLVCPFGRVAFVRSSHTVRALALSSSHLEAHLLGSTHVVVVLLAPVQSAGTLYSSSSSFGSRRKLERECHTFSSSNLTGPRNVSNFGTTRSSFAKRDLSSYQVITAEDVYRKKRMTWTNREFAVDGARRF